MPTIMRNGVPVQVEADDPVLAGSAGAGERAAIRVRYIKQEAQRRITGRFPAWKQTNMIARGVELQDIWRQNGAWTDAEAAEAATLQAAWDWIKAVRARSDALEADPELDIATGWPE